MLFCIPVFTDMIFREEIVWNTPNEESVIDFLRHVFSRLFRESKALSISEFLRPKDLEEGDCGEYLKRILIGVLSELKHGQGKYYWRASFMLSNFHLKVLRKLRCGL